MANPSDQKWHLHPEKVVRLEPQELDLWVALGQVPADLMVVVVVERVVKAVGVVPVGGLWVVVAPIVRDSGVRVVIPDLGSFLVEHQIRRTCRPRFAVPSSREMEEGASFRPRV